MWLPTFFVLIFLIYFTGPDLPLYDPDNCDHNGNFTCETSLDNVVDIYYFDAEDTFSCIDQVSTYLPIHSRPENFKKSMPKKLMKSNKSISRNFFLTNSIFCNFKNGQKNQFLN